MKKAIITLTSVAVLASVANAQTFADFVSTTAGDLKGTADWDTYGKVDWNLTYQNNTNGEPTGTNQKFARAVNSFEGNLQSFTKGNGTGKHGLALFANSIDGTSNVGYDFTVTMADGAAFSPSAVFYLGDIDVGDFIVSASLGGKAVDVSDWYFAAAQTSDDFSVHPEGKPSTWNKATSTLVGNGQSHQWVHQFKPDEAYDTLTFANRGGIGDFVTFGIGDVTVVPEPSSTALLGLGALGLLARRKR